MEFPSLHRLCIQSLAKYVENGVRFEDVLNDDEKQELMSCLKLENELQTRVALRKLFNNWEFKRIHLNSNHLSVLMYNVEIHAVEQLSLNSINQDALERIKNLLEEKHETPYHNLDVLKLIELFIPDNREKLWHLDVSRCDIRSSREMFEEMAEQFPNIKQLVLSETSLTDQNFADVCDSFLNLTHLNVANNDSVNDLSGISELESLEMLNIAACDIENELNMREIFTLNNLRVLDMSGHRGRALSQNLTHYLSCDQALPQLEFIDVSFNEITEEQLKMLVRTHPTLSTVSLIGTPLQVIEQRQYRGVELLTTQNMESCIRSMRRYSFAAPQKGEIMVRLVLILSENYGSQEESLLKKCLHELVKIKRDDYLHAQRKAIQCMAYLCRNGRIDKFSSDEVQKILNLFLNVCPTIWRVEDRSDDVIALQVLIWLCISKSRIVPTLTRNAEQLCSRAVEVMKRCSRSNTISRILWNCCFNALHNILDHNPGAYQLISSDSELLEHILFYTMDLIANKDVSIDVCKMANMIITSSANIISPGVLTAYSCRLLESSVQFQANKSQQATIQKYIQNLINSNRLMLDKYFELRFFSILTSLLTLRGFEAQKLTVMFFCWLKHDFECSAQNLTPENFCQMEAKATAIINSIFWHQPTGNDNLNAYEYLARHGRGEVAKWAEWILSQLPRHVQSAVGEQPAVGVQQAVEIQPAMEEN